MKIPVYTSQSRTTTEAPGKSFSARMDARPLVSAALSKGKVFSAAAQAAGEYAQARYKVGVENDLNEALLGAQESLRDSREVLAASQDYTKALDGDSPIWQKETAAIKSALLKKVGKNKHALTQFNARFGQLELQNRFALRDDIDLKLKAVAAANRTQELILGENTIADLNTSIADINLIIAGVKLNGDRLIGLGVGNGEALSKQEYAMVKRGTVRALSNLSAASDAPITAVSNVHKAIREDNPALAGVQGQKVYHLLKTLTEADQAVILRSVGATQSYINGPTIEEANERRVTAAIGRSAIPSIKKAVERAKDGFFVSDLEVSQIVSEMAAAKATMTTEEYAEVQAQADYLNTISVVAAETRILNGDDLEKFIIKLETAFNDAENPSQADEDILKFLRSRQDKLTKAVEQDPLRWANQNGVKINQVDYGNYANEDFAATLQERLAVSNNVQAIYERDAAQLKPVIMTQQETKTVATMLDNMDAEQQLGFIQSVQSALGKDAISLFAQLGNDAPMMAHIGGLIGNGTQAAYDISLGLQYDKQISINSLGDTGNDINVPFITADAFAGLPDSMRNGLEPAVLQSVEAILTYRVNNKKLDVTTIDQDYMRNLISYAMGGSKDGQTGGVGVMENGMAYLRPDGVNDEQFTGALENLAFARPEAAETIESIIGANYTVAAVRRSENGEIVYKLYLVDNTKILDATTSEVAAYGDGYDTAEIEFTYGELIQAGEQKAAAKAVIDKANLAKKAVNSVTTFKGLTEADLDAAKITLDAESRQADRAFVSKSSVLNPNAGRDAMSEYTLDAWREMSRSERKAKGLPVRGIDAMSLGFDAFKDTEINDALMKKIADVIAEDAEQPAMTVEASIGNQVAEGQSTGITGGAADAEIVQFNALTAMGKITFAEWNEMTAAQRKQDGLPATLQDVNTLGFSNFDTDGTAGLNN